jgi:hypothetical protein
MVAFEKFEGPAQEGKSFKCIPDHTPHRTGQALHPPPQEITPKSVSWKIIATDESREEFTYVAIST